MSDTQVATEVAAPAAASVVTDADLDALAGAAFDKVMNGAEDGAQDEPAEDAAPAAPSGRDEKGRFAPTAAPKPATETTETKPDAKAEADKPEAEAVTALTPPTSWRALGDEWATLPRQAQEKIIAREREINAGFSDMGRKVKAFEPIGQVLTHHKDFLARTQMDAPNLIHGLIGQYQALNANPQETLAALAKEYRVDPLALAVGDNPAAAIQRIAQQHRIDLLDLVANGEAAVQKSQQDPAIEELRAQLQALQNENRRITGHLTSQERAAQEYQERQTQARESQVMATISPVIDATPDWDSIAPRVASLLPLVQAENPNASPDAILTAAIEEARWADPKVRAKLTAEKAAQTTQAKLSSMTERAGKAKAAAAANVKGASSPATASLTEDAEIEATWRKLGLAS